MPISKQKKKFFSVLSNIFTIKILHVSEPNVVVYTLNHSILEAEADRSP